MSVCKVGRRIRSRSPSMAGNGWRANSIAVALPIRKATTRSPGLSRRPASFAAASPTPPASSIGWPMVSPLLPDLQKFGSYWWVIDQCEYATDLLFKERGVLETVRDDLVAMTGFGAVLRFLDRKPHPAFTGEVTIDRKTRPEG